MGTRWLLALRRFWRRITGNPFLGVTINSITDEDLRIEYNMDRMIREYDLDDDFRSFGNLEEYNREFLVFFKTHRREFLLDYSQKDGHFRV